MLNETIRAITDALDDDTIGVNVQLALLPIDAGDTVPPNVVFIGDSTRNFELAMGKTPLDVGHPLIAVSIIGPVDLGGEVVSNIRSAEIEVVIRYETEGTNTNGLLSDTYYTIRAIERCLNQFNSGANESMRTRNGIHLQEMLSMQHSTIAVYEQSQQVHANLSVTYLVRDTTP